MEHAIYAVKDVNRYLKQILEHDPNLFNIWIQGEISNYTLHRSGHMYFSIKDNKSVLKCIMFAGKTRGLKFIPKNGTKIIARGNISVYEPSGQYQLIVEEMQPDGVGILYQEFEKLKIKLDEEGLFSTDFKKIIPTFPKTIGIITSPTGAAVRDIITTIKRRYPICKIILYPVIVQGENAPNSIVNAIEKMNEHNKSDVLILGRGGGSIEDLWGFNDENVARAIFKSQIPIISAVGHETDTTISDYVSDIRAATPTGAAEIATPITVSELKDKISAFQVKYKRELNNLLSFKREQFNYLNKNLMLHHPKKLLNTEIQRYDLLHEQMIKNMTSTLKEKNNKLSLSIAKLDSLSPLKTLNRGFNVSYNEDSVIRSIKDVKKDDKIKMKLLDGNVFCSVENIEEENINEQ